MTAERQEVLEIPDTLGCRGFSVRIEAILPANPKVTTHCASGDSGVMSATHFTSSRLAVPMDVGRSGVCPWVG
jgi:hypothetical protein